jgi:alkanesulfonate monooxygenase SsuD/methylene tetrahydromethanopterin reductase-like flavin-dependent oxidoreductase (luciferase family)
MKTRFGVITPQWVLWDELVEQWQYVEKLGFDSVWVADHWVNFMQTHTPWFEAWTLLGGLALHTTRIRFGSLISPIPFHNPAFLARRALTVDHISSGRLELGLGAGIPGEYDPSYAMAGIEDYSGRERVERFREGVSIIDMLLRQEVTTYDGSYYKVQDAVMQPRPVQKPRPPITIGAIRPAMLKLAARHAETWSFTPSLYPFTNETLQFIRKTNSWVDDYCEKIGRDPASLRRSALHFNPKPGMEFPFESLDEFRDIVESVLEVGLNEIILQYPTNRSELPLFERVATEVLPKLRA